MAKRLFLFFESSQIIRFVVGGGVSVIAFFILFILLTEIFKVWYFLSAFLSWIVYYTLNFTIHKFWTFESKSKGKLRRQLTQHLTLAITNLGLNAMMLLVFVEWFDVWYLYAQGIITIILTIVNYLMSRIIFTES